MEKVCIIEDDERIARLIKKGLEAHGYEVDLAYDGEVGKKIVLQKEYDLIIMDIILPQMSGLGLCRKIKEHRSDIPVIMLTALGTTDDKVEGFDAGADDYMVKPFEMRELLARTRSLIHRYSLIRNQPKGPVLQYADMELDQLKKTFRRSGTPIHLTPKEFKLMEFMMLNSERVLSRQEIAEKVWETHFDTGTNFIDVYINYLRKKVDVDFSQKLIHTRQGMGFILQQNTPHPDKPSALEH